MCVGAQETVGWNLIAAALVVWSNMVEPSMLWQFPLILMLLRFLLNISVIRFSIVR